MANYLVNIYQGAVTAGGTNGTKVSTDGTFTAPVDVELDASQNESKIIPLAIRADSGYKTTGTTVIKDEGDTNDHWKLCWTQNGTFADSISTADAITATNTLFYAKASSADTEMPSTDRSAKFRVTSKITTA